MSVLVASIDEMLAISASTSAEGPRFEDELRWLRGQQVGLRLS